MKSVPAPGSSSPALGPTSLATYEDFLRESYDHIDPTTGRVLWQVTAEDVAALEMELQDDAWALRSDAWAYAPRCPHGEVGGCPSCGAFSSSLVAAVQGSGEPWVPGVMGRLSRAAGAAR